MPATEVVSQELDDPGDISYSPKSWQRFYMGYKERFEHDCCIHLSNTKVVRLQQAPSANCAKRQPRQLDKQSDPALTGCTVWDGAIVLAQYLTTASIPSLQPSSSPSQRAVLPQQQQQQQQLVSLELGAGTGAVSLALLASGRVQKAIITDIPDMLAHLQHNVHYNTAVLDPARAIVKPLRWGDLGDVEALKPYKPPFDLIVGSDLIYYSYTPETPHSRLLLTALQQLAGPNSHIYLALSMHHNPEEVESFLHWSRDTWGFSVTRITQQVPRAYRVHDVLVVCLRLVDPEKAALAAAAAAAGTLERREY